jgi:AraC-like DNA-binding protein
MREAAENSISFTDDRTHVRVQRVGLLECYPWWSKDRRCDPYWRLYANDAPGASLAHGTDTTSLDRGIVVLVPAWCTFATRITRRGIGHFYIHFEILNLSRPLTERWFPDPLVSRDPGVSSAAAAAREDFTADKRAALLCSAKAAVYGALRRSMDALPIGVQERWAELVDGANPLARALRFIEDHLSESITVETIAERSCLGRDQFSRLFRQAIGQAPHHYIMDRRLAASAQLLAFGDEGLDTIAERCGFTDRAHLSRLFLRRFGISPSAYRREREKDARDRATESRAAGQ